MKSTAAYVPPRIVTNDELSKLVDTSDEWILSRTGIRARHISTGENTSDLCANVCRQLLQKSGLSPLEIDMILVATISADYATPSTACITQGIIGAHNAFCFDIGAACSGFLYGLSVAEKMIASGQCRNVIVIGAEILSKMVDWTDRTTCVLFGDGAGGMLLMAEEEGGILGENLFSDGCRAMAISGGYKPVQSAFAEAGAGMPFIRMDGREVFDFATREVPKSIAALLEQANLSAGDISWFVPHQANERIVQIVARKLGVDMSRFYINIERFGNTSSASIPIALAEMVDKGLLRLGSGEKIVLSGFGGGVTWGSMLVQL